MTRHSTTTILYKECDHNRLHWSHGVVTKEGLRNVQTSFKHINSVVLSEFIIWSTDHLGIVTPPMLIFQSSTYSTLVHACIKQKVTFPSLLTLCSFTSIRISCLLYTKE